MKVIILRGLPGAGKTTWVAQNAPKDAVVCSADHWFQKDGQYVFNREQLGDAHRECQVRFEAALANKAETVIVDNTNLVNRDMVFYVEMALIHKYDVEIRTIKVDPTTSLTRNIHNVPADTIARMQANFMKPLRYDWLKYEVQS